MKTVKDTELCYAMSRENTPILYVEPNEIFRLETKDCYSNNLASEKDVFTKEMWDTVNPATGPVFIKGTNPGSVLKVDILEIEVRDFAVTCVENGSGALGKFIEGTETKLYPVNDGKLLISEKLSVPINPMIGVIATAPEGKAVLNGTPGEHGGNMDCKVITAGSSVYLPVNTEGALLAAGDLHALMGDGEVCICGAEVSGKITMKASLHQHKMPTPCVETEDHIYIIASAKTLEECENAVLEKTHNYLTNAFSLSANESA
jgi:amidase